MRSRVNYNNFRPAKSKKEREQSMKAMKDAHEEEARASMLDREELLNELNKMEQELDHFKKNTPPSKTSRLGDVETVDENSSISGEQHPGAEPAFGKGGNIYETDFSTDTTRTTSTPFGISNAVFNAL